MGLEPVGIVDATILGRSFGCLLKGALLLRWVRVWRTTYSRGDQEQTSNALRMGKYQVDRGTTAE